MSATGVLILALAGLIALGALAAWLLNVPLWAVGVMVIVASSVARWMFRRFSRSRARQETETPT